MKVKFLQLRVLPDGVELHWRDQPEGASLQGWYRSKTKARTACKLLEPLGIKLERRCPNGHPMGDYDANCDHECIGK